MAIVTDPQEQDSKSGIYWVGRTLPSLILSSLLTTNDSRTFGYKSNEYKVISYQTYYDFHKYLSVIARFCNPESPQTVYVFAQKNIAHYQSGNYESVTAMIPCSNVPTPVPLQVYFEKILIVIL